MISSIYLESFAMFGAAQADRYHQGLAGTFAFLAENPRAARWREEIERPVRAFPYKAHLIVYDVDADIL